MMKRKVLLVGWDAADWKVVNPLMDRGYMPTVQSLIERGVMGSIATLSPVLSPMLWTSIATGKRPYKHGILGFIEPSTDGNGVRPVTNLSRKTKAIWNILTQNGLRSNVVGWWPSHPAEPINGVMVSNHYQRAPGPISKGWPMKEGTVHPERLREVLTELRVHPQELGEEDVILFVPDGKKIDQEKDRRLESIVKIIADAATIQSAATHLIESEPWDFMGVYFDAIDHFCHGFVKYHPPRLDWVKEEDFEIYQNVVSAGYVFHDMMLARLLDLAGPDTTVILMSDHGFHPDHLRRKELALDPAAPAAEHRDLGIFVMAGPGIRKDSLIHGINLLDVAPTVLTLFGLPIDEQMDGRVITEAFETPPDVKVIPDWDKVPGEAGCHDPKRVLSSEESKEGIEQLVALGYVDRPSEDNEKAVRDTIREMNYNLARAYMDGGMHGLATPILFELYRDYPTELRYGVQLAICLQSLHAIDDLERLVADLKIRWQRISGAARDYLKEIADISKERKALRKKVEEQTANSTPLSVGVSEKADPQGIAVEPMPAPKSARDKKESVFNRDEQIVIRKLRAIGRGNAKALDFLASWVSLARGDVEAALKHLDVAGNPKAISPGFLLQVGEAYRRSGNNENALRTFRRVLKLDPDNANAYLGMSRTFLMMQKSAKARTAAEMAIGLKYLLPTAHYCLGTAKMRKRDFEGAIKSLETAISQNPNFYEAHVRLARIYRKALANEKRAEFHEAEANDIRVARRNKRKESILAPLPSPHEIDFYNILPRFKSSDAKNLRLPSLAEPVVRRPADTEVNDLNKTIVIVSGLPRSGTSMAMQMLEAGGLRPMTDGERQADENNPRGYLELERVKQLPTCNNWLGDARGQVVKIVAPLIPHLPQGYSYRIVFMDRSLDEIVASQSNMLNRLGRQAGKLGEEKLKEFMGGQLRMALNAVRAHKIPALVVSHRTAMNDPESVAKAMSDFLGGHLDQSAMCAVVDTQLHRERAGSSNTK